jgi:hypothetical protein
MDSPCLETLAPNVHAVSIGDDLVLLDVANDAYFCMPSGAGGGTVPSGASCLRVSDNALRAEMTGLGLLSDKSVAPAQLARLALCRPTRDVLDEPPRLPSWRDLVPVLRLLWDAKFVYRRRSLADLLKLTLRETEPSVVARAPSDALMAEVRRFRHLVLWAPVSPKCLLLSFLLLRHLRRAGHDAAWVFGVRSWPFAAHCWLQVSDVILDDAHERLTAYEAVMTV